MNHRKSAMSFWYDTEDNKEMFGIIALGYKFNYNVFIGNIYSNAPLKKVKGHFNTLKKAREVIENEIRKTKIPYVVRTSVNEYYNGDHCTLRFEHFNAEGKVIDKYYEAQYSLNRYLYNTTYNGDVLYAAKKIIVNGSKITYI